ncbi:Cytochrome c oxidase subunit 2 [Achromobacter veterisilvae]|uniref:Cytochrome c oxidase subunit 2 n=1 Tax=Achromobacter veterisilvae TaxID=2069367 RepID=A0A446CH67_9BURK|nr:c-type cytochrome [Achromobacter veterisilvae]SSW67145.1 Cytochrome c oxidase subunit 2 [Achromobacter veterisilvae]
MTNWKVAGVTILACAAGAVALGSAAVYWGWYDVSATGSHTIPVYELLDTAQTRSVQRRSTDLVVPDLDAPGRVQNGFGLFRTHCVQCHGAPGIAPEPFALGLNPAPAALVATARDRPAADIFWIVRQGVKMTGMPAWRYRLTDTEIWNVVAFMRVLPSLSPEAYQERAGGAKPSRPEEQAKPAPDMRVGDAAAGRDALSQYLCATCHVIPGVAGARHHVGPPLAGIASRPYIAGTLPNTPTNMQRWLRQPARVKPWTAMPDLGLTGQDARDIAAFLYTLPSAD